MTDIVERLRDPRDFSNYHVTRQMRDDAADEIERLRAEVAHLKRSEREIEDRLIEQIHAGKIAW